MFEIWFTKRLIDLIDEVYEKVYHFGMKHDYKEILNYQINKRYLNARELEYGNDPFFGLSPYEYEEYLAYLEDNALDKKPFNVYPLRTFNSKRLYLCVCEELRNIYRDMFHLIKEDMLETGSLLSEWESFDFDRSRIFSEIEGSLNVENVPTTRRRVRELLEKKIEPANKNDVIIRNMGKGIDFVRSKPPFSKENLRKLYDLLTEGCLEEDEKLRPGEYYRYDGVEVDNYQGCPVGQIEECMDSLFAYVNGLLDKADDTFSFILPHICHYYIIYIHPYFDYNGRTARMVSFWIYLLISHDLFPPLISEMINQTKSDYYRSIRNSRNAHNDLTYFVLYLLKGTVSYYLNYKNLEHISQESKNRGIQLTEAELNYLKCILFSSKGAFNYLDFLKFSHISISKQGALKTLNRLIEAGGLVEISSKSKTKLFSINDAMIKYKLS